jgi:hypothetical protein
MGEDRESRVLSADVESNGSDIQNDNKGKEKGSGPTSDDPFGSEEVAEVKYKTMNWWYVPIAIHGFGLQHEPNKQTGNVACVREALFNITDTLLKQ